MLAIETYDLSRRIVKYNYDVKYNYEEFEVKLWVSS